MQEIALEEASLVVKEQEQEERRTELEALLTQATLVLVGHRRCLTSARLGC